jgi:hypothetical protein
MEITGAWTVNFDTVWGGSESAVFPELVDWSQHADERIKYYSGAAVYSQLISLPKKTGHTFCNSKT